MYIDLEITGQSSILKKNEFGENGTKTETKQKSRENLNDLNAEKHLNGNFLYS